MQDVVGNSVSMDDAQYRQHFMVELSKDAMQARIASVAIGLLAEKVAALEARIVELEGRG